MSHLIGPNIGQGQAIMSDCLCLTLSTYTVDLYNCNDTLSLAPFPQTIFHFNCLVLIIINSLFGKKSKFKYQFEFLQSIRVGCQLAANIYFPGEITEY